MRLLTQLKKIVRDEDNIKMHEFVSMINSTDVKGRCYGSDLEYLFRASGEKILGVNVLFKFGYLQAMQDMGKECKEEVTPDEEILSRSEKSLVEMYRQISEEDKFILLADAHSLISVENLKKKARETKGKFKIVK